LPTVFATEVVERTRLTDVVFDAVDVTTSLATTKMKTPYFCLRVLQESCWWSAMEVAYCLNHKLIESSFLLLLLFIVNSKGLQIRKILAAL